MNKLFIPLKTPDDWRLFLANPKRQWKTGYSAKALARCWTEAHGFPSCVKKIFDNSGLETFSSLNILLAFPEYKIPLPPYNTHASQSDIFILAKGNGQLISIIVEGKAAEPFDKKIDDWNNSSGKQKRLNFLLETLRLSQHRNSKKIGEIPYQLLHRTACAVIEAEKFTAKSALMLVHSFSQDDKWFNDYNQFLSLFDCSARINSLVFAKKIRDVNLFFCWVRGDEKFLEK